MKNKKKNCLINILIVKVYILKKRFWYYDESNRKRVEQLKNKLKKKDLMESKEMEYEWNNLLLIILEIILREKLKNIIRESITFIY